MPRQMLDLTRRRPHHRRCQRKQGRRSVVDVTFKRGHGRHRIVVEIELMLLDQAREPLHWQSIAADGQQQFGCNWISLDAAVSAATEHVAPPLQAYLAWKRLA